MSDTSVPPPGVSAILVAIPDNELTEISTRGPGVVRNYSPHEEGKYADAVYRQPPNLRLFLELRTSYYLLTKLFPLVVVREVVNPIKWRDTRAPLSRYPVFICRREGTSFSRPLLVL